MNLVTAGFALAMLAVADDPALESYVAHVAAAEASLRLGEIGAVRRWLDAVPEEQRGWEWRHIDAASDASLARFDCGATVFCVAASPDGTRIAAALSDGTAKVLDAATGATIAVLRGHTADLYSVAFSPDGMRLATASLDKTARTWDAATGDELAVFTHANPVTSVVFTPDGARVASASYVRQPGVVGIVKIWDAATGAEFETRTGGVKPLSMLAMSPDGTRLAASSWEFCVFVWDLGTDAEPRRIGMPDEGVYNAVDCIAFDAAGKRIACGGRDRAVRVFDVESGEPLLAVRHPEDVTSVAFHPTRNVVASASVDDTVRLWDVASGIEIARLVGHEGAVRSVAFLPGGATLTSGAADGTVRSWSADARGPEDTDITAFAVALGGARAAFCCGQRGTRLMDPRTGNEIAFLAHPGVFGDVATFSADGATLAIGRSDAMIFVYSADDGEVLTIHMGGHDNQVVGLRFFPDGSQLASAGYDGKILVSNLAAGAGPPMPLEGHTAALNSIDLSADGKRLASAANDRTVRVWDAATGAEVWSKKPSTGSPMCVAFHPSGEVLASAGEDGLVRIFDAASGSEVHTIAGHDQGIGGLAFSPDGSRLAARSGYLTLIDTKSWTVTATVRGGDSTTWNLAFDPDGSRILACPWQGPITVYDTKPLRARLRP